MSNLSTFSKNLIIGLLEENRKEIDAIIDNLHSDLEISAIDKLFSLMQLVEDNNKVFKHILKKQNMKKNQIIDSSLYWKLWDMLTEKQRESICGDYFDSLQNSVKMWSTDTLIIECTYLIKDLQKRDKKTLVEVSKLFINILEQIFDCNDGE